jgi:hypothetical protein
MKKTLLALSVATLFNPLAAIAGDTTDDVKNKAIEHMQILSHGDKLRTESGSSTLLTELELEKHEYDDIHRILASVPGVNIREEDGFGLRPNIGFRGVNPERSKKNYNTRRWYFNWPGALLSPCSLLLPNYDPYDSGRSIQRPICNQTWPANCCWHFKFSDQTNTHS